MIVISGITSSLGISLARLLAAKGIRVIGFARNIDKARKVLVHPLIKLVQGDVNDNSLMNSICSNAQGVVHLAALSAPWGTYADFFKVNVEGTQSIVKAAFHCKLNRFIYISTPSLYFDYRDRVCIKEEEALPRRMVNAYAETKKMAEEIIDEAYLQGLPCITLRPRAIFGPHDQALFPRVLKTCQKKGIPQFKKHSPLIDITYVDNVAQAISLAIKAPPSCLGKKYNITNGEPLPLYDILQLLLNKLSHPTRMRKVPYPLAYSAAWFCELKSRITGKEPLLTRYGVGVMSYSQTLSIQKARDELNYKPTISLSEGVQRYVDWLQTH